MKKCYLHEPCELRIRDLLTLHSLETVSSDGRVFQGAKRPAPNMPKKAAAPGAARASFVQRGESQQLRDSLARHFHPILFPIFALFIGFCSTTAEEIAAKRAEQVSELERTNKYLTATTKRTRAIRKKLRHIDELKKEVEAGKVANQEERIVLDSEFGCVVCCPFRLSLPPHLILVRLNRDLESIFRLWCFSFWPCRLQSAVAELDKLHTLLLEVAMEPVRLTPSTPPLFIRFCLPLLIPFPHFVPQEEKSEPVESKAPEAPVSVPEAVVPEAAAPAAPAAVAAVAVPVASEEAWTVVDYVATPVAASIDSVHANPSSSFGRVCLDFPAFPLFPLAFLCLFCASSPFKPFIITFSPPPGRASYFLHPLSCPLVPLSPSFPLVPLLPCPNPSLLSLGLLGLPCPSQRLPHLVRLLHLGRLLGADAALRASVLELFDGTVLDSDLAAVQRLTALIDGSAPAADLK